MRASDAFVIGLVVGAFLLCVALYLFSPPALENFAP